MLTQFLIPENIIEVSHLTKKFSSLTAVNDVSFSVKKGEIFAFLGPNGAGKSTTIKILTTLLLPTSGQVTVNGFNIATQKDQVRKSFGIIFPILSSRKRLRNFCALLIYGTAKLV